MSATIAVALITALSTLAGVAISGTITLLVSRSQHKTQQVLADVSRIERRARDLRQTRRDAYVQFMNQVSLIEGELDRCWQEIPPDAGPANFLKDARAAIEELNPLVNLVTLEGSDGVRSASQQLQIRFTLEVAKMGFLFDENKTREALMRFDEEAFMEARMKRGEAKDGFVKNAQEALDSTPNIKDQTTDRS